MAGSQSAPVSIGKIKEILTIFLPLYVILTPLYLHNAGDVRSKMKLNDHLDFHKTLENYANAKQLLFKKTRGKKIAVINGDDPHASHFELEGNQNLLISDQKR